MMDRREQGTKNLELMRHAFRSILRSPTMLDGIPDGATIGLMPAHDEALLEANVAMFRDMPEDVYAMTVDTEPAPEGRSEGAVIRRERPPRTSPVVRP